MLSPKILNRLQHFYHKQIATHVIYYALVELRSGWPQKNEVAGPIGPTDLEFDVCATSSSKMT